MNKGQQTKSFEQNKEFVIEYKKEYPFMSKHPGKSLTLVKFSRSFDQANYQILKHKIASQSRLKHQSLISIVKAFESKKHKYFDIFYEYVHFSLISKVTSFTKQQIQQCKITLYEICNLLIANNYNLAINTSVIGFTDRGILKYFLHYDTPCLTNVNKNQFLNHKLNQINRMFLAFQKPPDVITIPTLHRQNSISSKQMSSQYKINFNYYSPSQSHSPHPSQPRTIRNQNFEERLEFEKIKQYKKSASKPIETQFNFQSQQRKLSPRDAAYHGQQFIRSSYVYSPPTQRSSSPPMNPSPFKEHIQHYVQQNNVQVIQTPKQLYASHNYLPTYHNPPIRSNHRRFDEISVDTYHQELGPNLEMPKILPNTEMRQTTSSPFKYEAQTNRDRLHESIGFKSIRIGPVFAETDHHLSKKISEGYHKPVNVQYTPKNIQKKQIDVSKKQIIKKKQDSAHKLYKESSTSPTKKSSVSKPSKKTKQTQVKSPQKRENVVKVTKESISNQTTQAIDKRQLSNFEDKSKNQKSIQLTKVNEKLKKVNIKSSKKDHSKQISINEHLDKTQKDDKQIEDDFSKLHVKNIKIQRTSNTSLPDQEKSRQYLYRYENIFPECGLENQQDQQSVRNLASLNSHLDQLYNQSLKFQKNDALISEFNTLFQCDATPTSSNCRKQVEPRPSSPQRKAQKKQTSREREKPNKMQKSPQLTRKKTEINQRVKEALKKSEATLQYFNKLKKS